MQNKCRIALEDLQPYLRDPDQWSDDLHRGNFLRGCTARPQSLAKTSRREAVAARSIRRIMLTLPKQWQLIAPKLIDLAQRKLAVGTWSAANSISQIHLAAAAALYRRSFGN